MRSVLLIVLTLGLLVGGFLWYVSSQPATNPVGVMTTTMPVLPGDTISTTQPGGSPFGAGEGAWANSYDQTTGRLASRFRAKKYQPQPDGTVHVEHPQVEFYDTHERLQMTLDGIEGDVVMPGGADQSGASDTHQMRFNNKATAGLPNRGQIRGVTVNVYSNGETARPMVVTLNNVAFDNETFRIYTESFVGEDGIRVAGDRVPVTLRGPDYDFDGTGLTVRWNEKDRVLQSLEIAHGDKVVARNSSAVAVTPTTKPASVAASMSMPLAVAPTPVVAPAAPAVVTTAPPVVPNATLTPARTPAYRATFFDGVRAFEGDTQIASGQTMTVDFLMEQAGGNEPAVDTAPRTLDLRAQKQSATNASTPVAVQSPASTKPVVVIVPATSQSARVAVATTAPAPAPLVIRWTGKLTIYPIDGPAPAGVERGQSVVSLVGSPVKIDRQGTSIRAAGVAYRTKDATVLLTESPSSPLVLTDARGSRVNAKSIDFSTSSRRATLRGPASATLPVEARNGSASTTQPSATVAWQDVCDVTFSGADANSYQLRSADLRGGVKIDHPQLKLSSDALVVNTAPAPGGRLDLQTLLATGNVSADVLDDKGQRQSITAQKLLLVTATDDAGRSYPKRLNADGDVHATDGKQSLSADVLKVKLRPRVASTQPATSDTPDVELDTLIATGTVNVTGADDSEATGADLNVTSPAGQARLLLRGDLTTPARVTDGQSTLAGPVIDVDPATKVAKVEGAGMLRLVQKQADATKPARPVDVAWSKGVTFDSPANLVTVEGNVDVKSVDPDGTVNGATGKILRLTLADASPTTRPTKSASDGAMRAANFDFLQGKVAREVTIVQDVEVKSVLETAAGQLLRRVNLLSSNVKYDLPDRRFEVPVPGRLLFEDRREPDNKPTAGAPQGQLANRGATAFQWSDRLVYDQPLGSATLNGNVVIVHQPPDGDASKTWRLDADRVTALLAPDSSSVKSADVQAMKLNKVVAEGALKFTSQDISFEATTVEYNPVTQIMTARGSTQAPAMLTKGRGYNRGNFDTLELNLRTNDIKATGFRASVRR